MSMISFPSFRPVVVLVIAFQLLVYAESQAHTDPRGDVHPRVRVEDGNFAIYFHSNIAPRKGDNQEPSTLRMVYSPMGKLLVPREVVTGPILKKSLDDEWKPLHDDHFAIKTPGEVLLFPRYARQFSGKPYFIIKGDDAAKKHSLPWPRGVKISGLHDVIADQSSIGVAAVADTPDLSFYRFSRNLTTPPAVAPLGTPATIYSFPVASNIVHENGKYWIGWMRMDGEKWSGREKYTAVLSSWKPGEPHATTLELKKPADWNVYLSLAATGDTLCLAYHCRPDRSSVGGSEIITVFHSLK